MAIAFGAKGATAYATGLTITPAYPSGITAGQLLILVLATRDPGTGPRVEGNWAGLGESVSTTGTQGLDTGPVRTLFFGKIADGTETGSLGGSYVTSGSATWAEIYRFTSTTGKFAVDWAKGEDTSSGTAFSAACSPMPRLGNGWIAPGDLLLAAATKPTDAGTWSGQAFSVPGLTIGTATEITDAATDLGNDLGGSSWYAQVTSGTQTSPVVTATATTTESIYGGALVLRIRDTQAVASTPGMPFSVGESAGRNGNNTGLYLPPPIEAQDGDLLVAGVSRGNGGTISDYLGWTVVTDVAVNTRRYAILTRIFNSADPDTAYAFTMAGGTIASWAITAIRGHGAETTADVVAGTASPRSGSVATTTAPSITAPENSLALAFFGEGTNALGAWTQTTGDFELLTEETEGPYASAWIEYATLLQKKMPAGGATGNVVLTYAPAGVPNGLGQQIAIPPAEVPVLNVPYVVGFSEVAQIGTPATMTVPKPSVTLMEGDLLLALFRTQSGSVTTHVVGPSGWASAGPAIGDSTAVSARRQMSQLVKRVGDPAAEPSSYVFDTADVAARKVAQIIVLRADDGWAALDGFAPTYGGLSGTDRTTDSYTTSDPSLAIFWGATEFGSPAVNTISSTPSGYTPISYTVSDTSTSVSRTTIWSGYRVIAATTVPGATIDWAGTTAAPSAGSLSFKVIPVGVIDRMPSVVGYTEAVASVLTAGTLTIPTPTGLQVGDTLVAILRNQNNAAPDDWTAPSSWTRVGPAFPGSTEGRLNTQFTYTVTNVAATPSSFTFNRNSVSGNRSLGQIVLVRPGEVGKTAVVSEFWNSTTDYNPAGTIDSAAEAYNITSPSMTLYWAGAEISASASHVITDTPAGYTTIRQLNTSESTSVARSTLYTAWRTWPSGVTTTDMAGVNWEGTVVGPLSGSLTFVDGDMPDNTGLGLVAYNGLGQETRVFIMAADGPRTPSAIIPMRRGFDNVADMLATPGFTWGHRGNSVVLPECSLLAYTYTVARGYGVLEVSFARSSDGVWFGLHDEYLDRTALGVSTQTLDPAEMTWAEIQAYGNIKGSFNEPYMRWEEYVEAYGDTHITVADPKYTWNFQTEFLNMLEATTGVDRTIVKYSGVGSGSISLAAAARAKGFQTWGYFYIADASAVNGGGGQLQTWGSNVNWTMIGMEHAASQAIWNEALALGKPVIGHIANTQAQYDTAMAKGASGVQCGGSNVIEPVSWWTQ